jgi:hypothetical protein
MATTTEEPQLLGSVPGVEDTVEIGDAVREQGRGRLRCVDDDEILRLMYLVEDYLGQVIEGECPIFR